jgi:hypothetical protein
MKLADQETCHVDLGNGYCLRYVDVPCLNDPGVVHKMLAWVNDDRKHVMLLKPSCCWYCRFVRYEPCPN